MSSVTQLPDALASRILNQDVAPQFRAGAFTAGVERAVQEILTATRGSHPVPVIAGLKPPAPTHHPTLVLVLGYLLIGGIILGGVVLAIAAIRTGSGRRRRRGYLIGHSYFAATGGHHHAHPHHSPSGGVTGSSGGFSGGGFTAGGGFSGGGGASGGW